MFDAGIQSVNNTSLPSAQHKRKEIFYLTTQLTHFSYGYIDTDIGQRTIQIAREETHCHHYMGYSFRLAERDILYTLSHRQVTTHYNLYYTSR